ncbi:MAG: hypothetical protein PF574_03330 [Candidatus Delongbacteria bacterium]|jgi:hypothetical protein|nr:hypothetical protein [Candidatus Delongbacteria bacterium]
MKSFKLVSVLFVIGGLYDGLLGLYFLMFPLKIFDIYEVTRPDHVGYIHFPALLLITFGIMFFQIASDPKKNENLIPYGILLKISFCSAVLYHWFDKGIPYFWKPFAFFDLGFLLLFFWAFAALKRERREKPRFEV